MPIIGLTGSFGSGKTFVASIFKSLGAKVIDADEIAHGIIENGTPAYKKIIRLFGKGILDETENIDRKKLSVIVFGDRNKLGKLNKIVHPEVIKKIKTRVKKLGRSKAVVVIDAPLLIEANLAGFVEKLVVVKASIKKQTYRCGLKFNITQEECRERIKCQMPLAKKIELADFVIDNDGTKEETKKQVKDIWKRISRD